ncbi:MAG TPA: S8 family serine peptidase, partial [Anaerolineales bacterium]|nr:S8 family serine peptidase [Anaerolineales bacterium]
MKTTSKIRFFVILAALGVLFALNAGGFASAIGNLPLQAEDKIEPGLRDQILADGQGTYILQMAVQADLGLGYRIKDRAERGQFVYDTLRKTAASSQANIKIYLNRQLSEAKVSHYQSFFIANAILVTSDLATLDTIAARGDVAYIYAQKFIPVPEPDVVKSPEVLEWGVEMIRADEVWSTYGVTGQGIVVANIDTGVRLTHEALVAQYRGTTTGSDDYNFYDPANICGGAVCDNNGHGTHTMGTMVGDDGGVNQIGVAPGAQWIAAKGCEGSSCSVSSLLSSAEWMLAPCPFGVAPGDPSCDPNMRPHIINNSWGGGGGDPWYQASVNAWDATGILHVFSGGNSGPGSNTIGSPSDYCNTLSIGATDFSDMIGSFSSRGPGAFADCTDKPDMSAPGVNVRSSVNSSDTAYANYNGTSMAAPHVTGCIALLLSLDPGLKESDVFNLLTSTAVDLGAPGFDYDYGWGRIDCFAAASQLTPDFRLTANPNQQAVCFPDNVIYDIVLGSIAGYSDQVTLSTVGVPTGYTSGFSDNPVEPPGSSTMTLTSSGTALAGSYSIDVVGVAATSTHTATVTLDVYITVPGTPALASPVNGATEVGLQPTFTWSGDAPSYFIEIATDPDFTNIVASATVNDPTYVPGIELAPSTFYFWRVTGSNSCGDGAISSTFYFVTQAAPGACSIGQTPNVLLEESFESGATPPGWSHSGNGDTWTASTARIHAGTYSFHADDPSSVSEQYLYTPPII